MPGATKVALNALKARQKVATKLRKKKGTKSIKYKGITTHIAQVLCQNKKWVPPKEAVIKHKRTTKTKKNAKKKGLCLGRTLDKALADYVRTNKNTPKLAAVLARLKRLNITLVDAQTKVNIEELAIRTEIDAVGYQIHNNIEIPVVIELKNTQMSVAQHKVAYNLPSPTNARMTNGLVNSEKQKHFLQTAFGCIALKRLTHLNPKAYVIVNCADGCIAHPVNTHQYAKPSMFRPIY
jgi:hypothetical protein